MISQTAHRLKVGKRALGVEEQFFVKEIKMMSFRRLFQRSAVMNSERKTHRIRNLCTLIGMLVTTAGLKAGPQTYWGVANSGTQLVRIDKDTGVGTALAAHGFSEAFATAFTPDGTLWTTYRNNAGSMRLGQFNTNTGAITAAGSGTFNGTNIVSLAANSSGDLFGLADPASGQDDRLYSIDKTTGAATSIGFNDFINDPTWIDLAFDNTGRLFGLFSQPDLHGIVGYGFAEFDTSNAHIIGNQGMTNSTVHELAGMAFDDSGTLYLMDTKNGATEFYNWLPSTGVFTSIETVSGVPSDVFGGDFGPGPASVPLPTSLFLGLGGLLGVGILRKQWT